MLPILAGLIGIIGGIVLSLVTPPKEVIIRKTLPLMLTKNLTLQQLSANVTGKIIVKDTISFTLESNGNQIKIYNEPRGITSFTDTVSKNELAYEEVKVGDTVSGGVSIVVSEENAVGRTGDRKPGDIIGHHFNVN